MENIGEVWYCLVDFLTQGGPFGVLVLIASNKVVLFFNGIPDGIPCRGHHKHCRFFYVPLLRVSIPPVCNMGNGLEEWKSDIFPIEKIVDRKISFKKIQPTTSTSISPSNNGISKFTCTLKGVAWLLREDVSPIGSRRRSCANLSIILFLCWSKWILVATHLFQLAPLIRFSSTHSFVLICNCGFYTFGAVWIHTRLRGLYFWPLT